MAAAQGREQLGLPLSHQLGMGLTVLSEAIAVFLFCSCCFLGGPPLRLGGLSRCLRVRVLGSASPRRPVLTTAIGSKQGSFPGPVPNQPTLTPTLPRRESDFGSSVFAQL